MDRILLTFLDSFQWLYKLIGADYVLLRAIISVKLKTDNRRQHISYNRKNQNKEPGNSFVWTVFFYGLFGILIAFVILAIPSFMLAMIAFFSYVMVMIAMTLITDFSSILLDTSDNTIILPRPVDSRTVFVARVTHIMLYLAQLGIGLTIAPAIAVFAEHGLVVLLVFLTMVILSILVAVFLTNAVYLLILQFSSEEKLKSIINYFQIGMAVVIMGAYQIMPRIAGQLNLQALSFEIKWWAFIIPPVWMAGAVESVKNSNFDMAHIALAMCALVIPPAGLYLVTKYLTPVFNRKIGVMSTTVEVSKKNQTNQSALSGRIARWITRTPAENAAFNLIYRILGRDRKMKLKIYPTFGYVVIFGVMLLLQGNQDLLTGWNNLPQSEYFLVLFYITFLVMQVAFHEIPYADDFKASWIYHAAPIEAPGELLSGMIKAIFVRLFIPLYVAISIFVVGVWGISVIDDVIFGALNNYLMLMTLAAINTHHLPQSMAPDVRKQSGNLIRTILTFVVLGLLGLVHYLITFKPTFMFILIPVQLLTAVWLHRAYKRIKWNQITL